MVQWLLIIAIVATCLRVFFRPVPAPDRRPENWRSWDGFYALSYGSIMHGATGAEVSPELLKEHFAALRNAGYETVNPEDLGRYADGNHALPRKPLLLMFEGGRKDTALNVTPLLRQFGFVAVACINTGACESRDRFYLTASELGDLARQPHWYLGSMGHQAMSHISDGPRAQTNAHFLTNRKYENGISEDDTAFVIRVMKDYSTSANFLGGLTGRSPALFLYPYTDRGVGREADPLAGRVNRMAVELLYRLAFVDGYEPFNGPTRDRYALTRLRVDGRLTAQALVDRLAHSKPAKRNPDSPVRSADWAFSPNARQSAARKAAGQGRDQIQLEEGMAAWIAASEDWADSELGGTVQFAPKAIAGLYTRYADPEQCLYLSVSATGVRVQERSKPGSYVTLLDHKAKLEPGRDYQVRLKVKRNRAFVFLNGRAVGQALPLSTIDGHGRSGIGSNGGTSIFSAVTAGPLPTVYILGNQYRDLPASLRESALAFLPDLPARENEPAISVCLDRQQIDELMAAASEGVEPIPLINTRAGFGSQPCTRLSDLTTLKPLVRRSALRGIGQYNPQDIAERRVAPVRVLQADQVTDWMNSSKDTRQEIIVVEGRKSQVITVIDLLLHKIPPQRLVAGSVQPTDLPAGVGTAVHPRSPEQP